jgi:hypothetical protein
MAPSRFADYVGAVLGGAGCGCALWPEWRAAVILLLAAIVVEVHALILAVNEK